MNIFEEINTKQAEIDAKPKSAEGIVSIPQAYQIRKTIKRNGSIYEEIVDTLMVDKVNGIAPIEKAKGRAKRMTEITQISHYVVEIVHNIIATY